MVGKRSSSLLLTYYGGCHDHAIFFLCNSKPLAFMSQLHRFFLHISSEDNATPTRRGINYFEFPCLGHKSVNRRSERSKTQLQAAAFQEDFHKVRALISQ
jgi:hypothetical protein